jgi:hypothetical protein
VTFAPQTFASTPYSELNPDVFSEQTAAILFRCKAKDTGPLENASKPAIWQVAVNYPEHYGFREAKSR